MKETIFRDTGEKLEAEDLLPEGTYSRLEIELCPGKYLIVFVPAPMSEDECATCVTELEAIGRALAETLPASKKTPQQIYGQMMDNPERFAKKFLEDPVLRPVATKFMEACELFQQPNIREALLRVFEIQTTNCQ